MDTSLNKVMHDIQNKKSISERNITDVMKFIQIVPDNRKFEALKKFKSFIHTSNTLNPAI